MPGVPPSESIHADKGRELLIGKTNYNDRKRYAVLHFRGTGSGRRSLFLLQMARLEIPAAIASCSCSSSLFLAGIKSQEQEIIPLFPGSTLCTDHFYKIHFIIGGFLITPPASASFGMTGLLLLMIGEEAAIRSNFKNSRLMADRRFFPY